MATCKNLASSNIYLKIMRTGRSIRQITLSGSILKELPIIVYHEFRDGNAMGGIVEAIEAAYRVLPFGKKIRHASLDSEFYTVEVINCLDIKGTTFAIAADKDKTVTEAIKELKS